MLALPGISIPRTIATLLTSTDNNVVFWGIALLSALCCPPDVAFGGPADRDRAATLGAATMKAGTNPFDESECCWNTTVASLHSIPFHANPSLTLNILFII